MLTTAVLCRLVRSPRVAAYFDALNDGPGDSVVFQDSEDIHHTAELPSTSEVISADAEPEAEFGVGVKAPVEVSAGGVGHGAETSKAWLELLGLRQSANCATCISFSHFLPRPAVHCTALFPVLKYLCMLPTRRVQPCCGPCCSLSQPRAQVRHEISHAQHVSARVPNSRQYSNNRRAWEM